MKKIILLCIGIVVLVGVGLAWVYIDKIDTLVSSQIKPSINTGGKPNILFVLTDDLDYELIKKLPKFKELMTAEGMTFENNFVSLSLCCPSRTSILLGQYAHNTGIFTNGKVTDKAFDGGYGGFMSHGNDKKTVANDLQKAGYKTALFGKYLNGYEINNAGMSIPQGWSNWAVPIDGNPYSNYNFQLNVDGTKEDYYLANCDPEHLKQCSKIQYDNTLVDKNANYMTHVLTAKAEEFIKNSAEDNTPFFLYLSTYAPHGPATPSPEYEHLILGKSEDDKKWRQDNIVPRTPSFNESDISDKPSWMKDVEPLTQKAILLLDEKYQFRLASLYSVDDMLEKLITTLKENGQLENTYIVFTSDNGFHMGEHRLTAGKLTEFDTDLHTPLVVRGPGIERGSNTSALTGNIDFAPTFLELAGLSKNTAFDGHSFAPLFIEPKAPWRTSYLLEHGPIPEKKGDDQKLTNEPEDADIASVNKGADLVDRYEGLRTQKYTYVRYSKDGEEELYDNLVDPYQLSNIANSADKVLLDNLRTRTAALSTCKGSICTSLERLPL